MSQLSSASVQWSSKFLEADGWKFESALDIYISTVSSYCCVDSYIQHLLFSIWYLMYIWYWIADSGGYLETALTVSAIQIIAQLLYSTIPIIRDPQPTEKIWGNIWKGTEEKSSISRIGNSDYCKSAHLLNSTIPIIHNSQPTQHSGYVQSSWSKEHHNYEHI